MEKGFINNLKDLHTEAAFNREDFKETEHWSSPMETITKDHFPPIKDKELAITIIMMEQL